MSRQGPWDGRVTSQHLHPPPLQPDTRFAPEKRAWPSPWCAVSVSQSSRAGRAGAAPSGAGAGRGGGGGGVARGNHAVLKGQESRICPRVTAAQQLGPRTGTGPMQRPRRAGSQAGRASFQGVPKAREPLPKTCVKSSVFTGQERGGGGEGGKNPAAVGAQGPVIRRPHPALGRPGNSRSGRSETPVGSQRQEKRFWFLLSPSLTSFKW